MTIFWIIVFLIKKVAKLVETQNFCHYRLNHIILLQGSYSHFRIRWILHGFIYILLLFIELYLLDIVLVSNLISGLLLHSQFPENVKIHRKTYIDLLKPLILKDWYSSGSKINEHTYIFLYFDQPCKTLKLTEMYDPISDILFVINLLTYIFLVKGS